MAFLYEIIEGHSFGYELILPVQTGAEQTSKSFYDRETFSLGLFFFLLSLNVVIALGIVRVLNRSTNIVVDGVVLLSFGQYSPAGMLLH